MNTQKSFFQLFDNPKIKIVIPMIQRDYAQGRDEIKVNIVRKHFLNSLYSYLTGDKRRNNLDFIYAKEINNEIIPIDGQQRLTTLFLLHWYLAIKDDKYDIFKSKILNSEDNSSRFTYKIRTSSADFCNALIFIGNEINFLDKNKIRNIIENSKKFHVFWYKDPTVVAMIKMLEEIESLFSNYERSDLFDKLTDKKNPAITFNYLDLVDMGSLNDEKSNEDYKLNDDLYIKMNARGKPISIAEQFKGKIEQKLIYLIDNNSNLYISKGRINQLYLTFSKNIDTIWINLFWNICDVKTISDRVKKTDKYLMSFFRELLIFTYFNRLSTNKANNSERIIVKKIIGQQDISDFFEMEFYDDNVFLEFIEYLINVFTIITNENNSFNKVFSPDFFYFNEIEQFIELLENPLSLKPRIYFYLYFSYRIKYNNDYADIKKWMRLVRNILEASTGFNDSDESVSFALSFMELLFELVKNSSEIYSFISNYAVNNFLGLFGNQFIEEQIKCRLIVNNKKDWNSKINIAEKHPYFKGQISALLNFVGIEEFYTINKDLNLENEENSIELWDYYWGILSNIFDENGLNKEYDEEYILQRALLTKFDANELDYLLYINQGYSFLENSDRDVSWRRFLFADNKTDGKYNLRGIKRNFFKAVISDDLFEEKNIKKSLNLIIENSPKRNTFHQYFINNPALFSFSYNTKRIRFIENPEGSYKYCCILQKTRMSGKYKELYSLLIFIKLKELLPENSLNYYDNYQYKMPWVEVLDNDSNIMEFYYDNINNEIKFNYHNVASDQLNSIKKKILYIWNNIKEQNIIL